MKKIALTGGGTAGHVTPNIALIPSLQKRGYELIYIGSTDGIERRLIEQTGLKYFPVKTGKLRRYFDTKNITDMLRTVAGVSEARKILKKEKVDLVFSKGGFVGVPVVMGAWLLRIPVVIHEADYSPGLANRIAIPFAKKVCVSFPETAIQIRGRKTVLTGNPVRAELKDGSRGKGLTVCGFDGSKPVLLIIGGSLGSRKINDCVRNILRTLLPDYDIAHICGKGNVQQELAELKGYCQFDYVGDELPHIMACADIIISRAGANAVSEFLALKKPNLLIPLSKSASRGDQILNAESFEKQGFSAVLYEEQLSEIELLKRIGALYENRLKYTEAMSEAAVLDSVAEITNTIADTLNKTSAP